VQNVRSLYKREKRLLVGVAVVLTLLAGGGGMGLWSTIAAIDVDATERVEFFEQHVTSLNTEIGQLDLSLALLLSTDGEDGRENALLRVQRADEMLEAIITLIGDAPWTTANVFADLRTALHGYEQMIDTATEFTARNQQGLEPQQRAMIAEMRKTIQEWRAAADDEMESAQAFVYQHMEEQGSYQETLRNLTLLMFALFSLIVVLGSLAVLYQRLNLRRMKEDRDRYRQIFTSNHAVALLVEPHSGAIIDANPAAAEYYGWSIKQLRTMSVSQINAQSKAEIEREMAAALKQKRNHFFFRHILADGRERDVEVHSSPLEYAGQKVLYSIIHDITERRNAEKALAASEALYSAVINAASQGFVMVAPHSGVITDLNETMCYLLGKTRDEAIGVPFYNFAIPDERDSIREIFASAGATRHRTYEVTLRRGEMGYRLTSFHATSLFDQEGTLVGSYAFVDDISKRRESEARLRDSQSRLEVAIRAGNIGVWTYEPHGEAMTFSKEWKAQLGYAENEFPDSRLRWQEVIHPEDRAASEQACQDLLDEKIDAMVLTERYRHRDGHWVYVRSCASVVRNPEGEAASIVGAHVDLTPQYEIQESLARANARNALILDSATDGLLGVDELGRVTMVNAACQRLLGFVAKDIIGREAEEFLHPSRADGAPFDREDMPIGAVLNSGIARAGVDALVWRRDGVPLPVELGVAPMIWQDTVIGAIVIFHDISEAQRYRAELERSNNELEQFAYMASHDLQEPLRTVSSYLTLLRRRYADVVDDAGREFIGMAVDGANRMSTMIRDLLDYSRVGRRGGDMLPTPLSEAVESALSNLKMTIDDIGAKIDVVGEMPTVLADKVQLTSLMQNLVGNAIKYRDKDRIPEVTIQSEGLGDGQWRVAVSDNGIGIEDTYFERIFIPFQRLHTRDAFEGNGIGLAICRKIVERHGGSLTVTSTPGQGSCFAFTLKEAPPKQDGGSGLDTPSVPRDA
jgi:PAS domain S-box-containing protein